MWQKFIKLIENLSLHIVAGSLCSALFAAALLDAKLPVWWFVALAMAVWTIYTLDHLFDARLNHGRIINSRHKFHEKHFKKLLFVLSLTSLTVVLVFIRFASFPMWISAGVFAGFALIHILLVSSSVFSRKLWLQKEIQIALIYSVGIWLGALHLKENPLDIQMFMVFCCFTLLVWWETSFIAFNELEIDLKQQNSSMATRLGEQKTKKMLLLVLIFQLVFLSIQFFFVDGAVVKAYIILLMMGLAFAFLFLKRKKLSRAGLLHFAGELVFCLPVLVFLI
ncbi:MAG: hypothetical protein PHG67_09270 [Bacteroidales bacterium]|nr:hypothetical protein [Bacteroidales bacterium]HOI32326.1 hypothetical protein [Bacteroidales bacterium]